jgi:anaerobic selenocysteine-containing dehydrogenase
MTAVETIVHGTCHHDCPDSCGWHVTVSDGVAVQLRGNPDHPYSLGELCPKVNPFLERVYHPDRLTTPLRRVGPKGEGLFEPITWDQALDEISSRFGAIIDQHGAEAIMPYLSAGNQSLLALSFGDRFWHRLGGSRVVGALCGATAGAGAASTNGTGKGLEPVELRHSKLIILWGTNTRLTNRHLWPTIEAARADGARVVVIDPIRTMTAEAADWFIQPLPGTDVALMLAMMHVLIRDDLIDHEWVDEHTHGFAELRQQVAEWTPDHAAQICGLDPAVIHELATAYGTTRPVAIRTLIGAEHREHGAMFFRTLTCLPALVGAWRDRGGGFARSAGVWSDVLVDHQALSRPDLAAIAAPAGKVPRAVEMVRLGEVLTDATLSPAVHALVMIGVNPLVVVPNTELVRQGLLRDDLFTVVHEQFMTDSAKYADIVLPSATQIESVDVVLSWGHLNLGWNEPAIQPLGESVSNSELHRRLATAMGFTEPALFDDDMTVLRDALPAVDLELLRKQGFLRVPYPDDGLPFGDGVFPTASGKVELFSERLARSGQPALPTFTPARESPAGDPLLAQRFPFALLTPKQHTRFLNASHSHLPRHGPREEGPYVEMVADDAQRLGMVDGQLVEVFNDRGCVRVPVKVSERLRAGVVAIPWGWWSDQHPDGKVANALTNDTRTDWGGGVAFSDTLVGVRVAT